jgi:Large polyvalent protein-associated domain 7
VGDVPEAIKRRYYTEERGGSGFGFYVDARIVAPAFRDRGREIISPRADPNAIRDMVEIAKHRGWQHRGQGLAGVPARGLAGGPRRGPGDVGLPRR